jgi:hypothetical protein
VFVHQNQIALSYRFYAVSLLLAIRFPFRSMPFCARFRSPLPLPFDPGFLMPDFHPRLDVRFDYRFLLPLSMYCYIALFQYFEFGHLNSIAIFHHPNFITFPSANSDFSFCST